MRPAADPALPVVLDRTSGVPLPQQLSDAVRRLISDAVLRPGDGVPSTRALALSVGVARGSVVAAYDQLIAEGWLVARPGAATRVNPLLPRVLQPEPGRLGLSKSPSDGTPDDQTDPRRLSLSKPGGLAASAEVCPIRIDLRPGRPLQDDLPSAAWRSAWRAAADAPVGVAIPPLGWPPLREAIADHLRVMRGVACDPGRIVIAGGGREGLGLLLAATRVRTVGVEDPGFPSLRRVLERAGVAACSLPADAQGLVTAALPEINPPDAVIVTPSHQYPLGGTLPVDRRLALVAWARRHGVWIVEDDYDSELRYTSEPLPALARLDAGRVALLGTFSKTLTPALATGYVVLPEDLMDAAASVRSDLGQPVSLVTQRALAAYLASGALARHTSRMRRVYRRRRGQVLAALAGLPGARVTPMDGGLHAVVWLDRDDRPVLDALARSGVAVAGLAEYWASSPGRGHRGLVFGFGGVSDADLAEGLELIRAALSSAGRAPE